MNKIVIIYLALFVSAVVNVTEYKCSEHQNILSVTGSGDEHVNHLVMLNGSLPITEIEEGSWFIESVTCTSKGFELVSSHIQYNEPTKKIFNVVVSNPGTYEIE